jgi:RNA polymerase sigma-70 factor (ECF subfamily)
MTIDVAETKEISQYRSYLKFLARLQLANRYNGKVDQSDIVQQTLLKAFAMQAQFQGQTEAERIAWLRQILVRNVAHATREFHTKKRDIHREQSIEAALDASTTRLGDFLAANQSSPSQQLARKDRVRTIADAIEGLPDEQRQAIMLRYWEEKSLQEISTSLGKSTSAVAGLLHRATKKLRSSLAAGNAGDYSSP